MTPPDPYAKNVTHLVPGLLSARFNVQAFSFTDDDAMTESCTRKLLAAMPQARRRCMSCHLQKLA